MTKIYVFLLVLGLTACGFRYRRYETESGKYVWAREYKDDDRHERYNNKLLLKKFYRTESHSKYSQRINRGEFGEFVYFQYDSARIYIHKNTVFDSTLLTSGLLHPKLLFCAVHESCEPTQDSIANWVEQKHTDTNKTKHKTLSIEGNKPVDKDLLKQRFGWTGPRIYISEIKELAYLGNGSTKKLFSVRENYQHGGPSHHLFFIELTNERARKETSMTEFIKFSKISFIRLMETSFEI